MRDRSRVVVAVAIAFALVATAREAFADGMRCKGGLIGSGATMATVQTKCGAPTATSHREAVGVRRGIAFKTVTDVWTYDTGPRDFIRYLTFVDGVLRTIALGDYGTARP